MATVEDIRIKLGFFDHPKTEKLRRSLGEEGVTCLLRLWCFVAVNRHRGILYDMTEEDIEIAAKWNSKKQNLGKFFKKLVELRFLEIIDGEFCIHDWEANQEWAFDMDKRSDKAAKAAAAREAKRHLRDNPIDNPVDNPVDNQSDISEIIPLPYPSFPFLSLPKDKDTPLPPASGGSPPQGGPGEGVKDGDKSPKKTKNFRPPTVEEVDDYCRERENGIDASMFVDHYTANGWVTGKAKAPMRDWQAAVRNWEQYRKEQNANGSPPPPPPKEKPPDNPDAALLRKFPNAPPDFSIKKYCLKPDGQIDGELYDNVLRALHGNPNFAEYLPEWAKKQEGKK